jgi:hypothetical protein
VLVWNLREGTFPLRTPGFQPSPVSDVSGLLFLLIGFLLRYQGAVGSARTERWRKQRESSNEQGTSSNVATEQSAAAESAPADQEKELTAQQWFEQGFAGAGACTESTAALSSLGLMPAFSALNRPAEPTAPAVASRPGSRGGR